MNPKDRKAYYHIGWGSHRKVDPTVLSVSHLVVDFVVAQGLVRPGLGILEFILNSNGPDGSFWEQWSGYVST
jgi:hypothetical protein